ncbi:MAG: HlyD family efflux transporter periplasmic adaptor subunit [Bacteroidetes bacterium]|nr:HlyD family efflux transporter periplasmic adaptor subunit [Bacteroidota bacterium]
MTLSKSKKIIFLSVGIFVLLVIAILIFRIKPATGIYKIKRENFEAIITSKGEIQSEKAVLITVPDIIGDRKLEIWDTQIKDLIPEGSIVKKGDYVAQLDQGRIKQLKENNLDYLKKLTFNYNDAKIDSAVTLVGLRNGISQFIFDLQYSKLEMEQSVYESPAFQRRAQMAYDRALRQLDAKKRAYRLTQNALRVQITRLAKQIDDLTTKDHKYQLAFDAARIVAPRDGMLIYGRTYGRGGSRKLTIGSNVSMQNPVIATLPDLSVLVSETFVEEIYISKIKVGDSARVYIDALKNQEKVGVISNISNVGQEMTGFDSKVFKVNIRIASDNKRIKPAMTTNNEIIISREQNVLVIPRSALFSDGEKQFVYLKEFGGVTTRSVECGNQSDKFVVIKNGLKEGDKILLNKPEN